MAKITMTNISTDLTDAEKRDLDMLDNREIIYDDDSPRMTSDNLKQFHRFNVIPIKIESDNLPVIRSFGDNFQIELNKIVNDVLRKRSV